MKRVVLAIFVLLISISFVSTAFAQAKPAAPEKPTVAPEKPKAAPEKAAPAAEKPAEPAKAESADKPAEKPKPKPPAGFVGQVTEVNNTAQTLTVKGKKDTIVVDTWMPKLKGYRSSEEFKVGDKVAVKYAKEGIMITRIAAAKAEKKEAVKKEPAAKKEPAEKAEKKEAAVKKEPAGKAEKKEMKAKTTAGKGKGFDDVDTNKDSKITIEELNVVFIAITPDAFKKFDKNGDGALDKEEFKAVK